MEKETIHEIKDIIENKEKEVVDNSFKNNKSQKKSDREIIEKYLNIDVMSPRRINMVPDDNTLKYSDINSMKNHNENFDRLLSIYVDNAYKNLTKKFDFKKEFFEVCLNTMVLVTLLMMFVTVWVLIKGVAGTEIISILITNIGAFLTTFIILPKTIADYLFDSEEEKNMTEIIKNIQEHDKDIRNRLDGKNE